MSELAARWRAAAKVELERRQGAPGSAERRAAAAEELLKRLDLMGERLAADPNYRPMTPAEAIENNHAIEAFFAGRGRP